MKNLFAAVFVVGASSILIQLSLIREFLAVYYGNELVFGLILGNWLVLAGLGGFFGKKAERISDKVGVYSLSLLFSSIAAVVIVYASRIVHSFFVVRGESLSMPEMGVASFLVLAPFCVVSGFQVVLAASIFSKDNKEGAFSVGRVYTLDVLGDLFGGLVFSFVLVDAFNSFQVAYLAAFASIFAAAYLALSQKRVGIAVASVILFILVAFFSATVDLQSMSNQMQYPKQNIVFQKNSRYGNIVVTESAGQYNFFENGLLLFSTENTISSEETVHYAMIQHEKPETILLVSGGVSGTLREILKYDPIRVDYVELDPEIIRVSKEYVESEFLSDPRVRVHNIDGRLFVKSAREKYDVVVVDLPDPSTAQLNRFYTKEFASEVEGILNEGGVFSTSLSSSENYVNPETREINRVLYNTLAGSFENIIVVPGDENIFVASDRRLSYDIASEIKRREIKTEYVNEYYLPEKLSEDRIGSVQKIVVGESRVNTDFEPVAYLLHQSYWLSKFNLKLGFILPALLIAFALAFIRYKPVNFAVFTVGFSAIVLEILILLSFQVLHGFVYHKVGLIVTAFMAGLALGSYAMTNNLRRVSMKTLKKYSHQISLFSLVLYACIRVLAGLDPAASSTALTQIIFLALTLVLGVLTGSVFPLASKLLVDGGESASKTMGSLVSADLFGAFFGATLASVFLIPLIGVLDTCIIVFLLNLIAGFRLGK